MTRARAIAVAADPTPRPVPCLTVRASEAPETLGISLSLWNVLVSEGHLPPPFNPPGHDNVALYDIDDIRAAIRAWKTKAISGRNLLDEVR